MDGFSGGELPVLGPGCGAEPLVGEIVGLRTFRIDDEGRLLPLFSTLSWYDGANTATCSPPTGERGHDDHAVPAVECECGFYAYGSAAAARVQRQARFVQAVVSCWGGVVAGTLGFRAQHARVDALWLHPNVPREVRQRVASRYPSARLYADRALMLAEHPLSTLACYDPAPRRHRGRPAAVAAATLAVLGLGLVPIAFLNGVAPLHVLWLAATAATGLLAVWLFVGVHRTGHRVAALLALGGLVWMLAPMFGLAGWLLRLPLLRAAVIVTGGYLASLRPGFFPIDRTPRDRAFCGVRA
jgi:hypothetical protein